MNVPTEYQQFLTPLFLGALVMVLTGPFKSRVSDSWLPIVAMFISLALNVGLAYYLHLDPVLLGLQGVVTAFVASGIYSHATTMLSEGLRREGNPLPPGPEPAP